MRETLTSLRAYFLLSGGLLGVRAMASPSVSFAVAGLLAAAASLYFAARLPTVLDGNRRSLRVFLYTEAMFSALGILATLGDGAKMAPSLVTFGVALYLLRSVERIAEERRLARAAAFSTAEATLILPLGYARR